MKKPIMIDLFCGVGGWAEGFLARGYEVIGFDIIERPYPGKFIKADCRDLKGSDFKAANVIMASPPCDEFSKWGMKSFYPDPPVPSMELVETSWRIKRESGVLMILENVKGAVKFLGAPAGKFGSFYLWGDVPFLRPQNMRFEKGMGNRIGNKDVKDPVLRAKIPFPLAYWLAGAFL